MQFINTSSFLFLHLLTLPSPSYSSLSLSRLWLGEKDVAQLLSVWKQRPQLSYVSDGNIPWRRRRERNHAFRRPRNGSFVVFFFQKKRQYEQLISIRSRRSRLKPCGRRWLRLRRRRSRLRQKPRAQARFPSSKTSLFRSHLCFLILGS